MTEYVIWEDPAGVRVNEMFVSVRGYYDGSSVYAVDCDDYEDYADTGWYIDWNYAQYSCGADSDEAAYDVSMHFEKDKFCDATTNTYYLDEEAYSEPSSGTLTGAIDYTWSDGVCAWLLDEVDYPVANQFEMAPSQTALLPARRGVG